jgi:phage host-nuclease inhibitor protein Gam
MKTRNPQKQKAGITPGQFDAAMEAYARIEQREAELNRQINGEMNELLEQYTGELTGLANRKGKAFEIAQSYCLEHKKVLFDKRRSIGTLHGIAGFRLGNPQLKTAKGSNWKQVLAVIKEKLPEYVRITEEPAKDMLLADRHKERVAPLLIEIGVQVVQDELFFIESRKAA